MTLDVRYIGTLSRKSIGTMNVNVPNFLTNGLKAAFDAARRGGESTLLDQLFSGVRGSTSGAEFLRTAFIWAPQAMLFTPTSTSLAMGDYQTLANTLNVANATNFVPCGGNGCILRTAGLPENFIKTNPQYSTANWMSNLGTSNYNGLQAQVTLRPTHGTSFQGTYTWSRNLGVDPVAGFTDPRNRDLDYTLLSMDRTHTFTTYGTFDLPFGPKGYLLKSDSGVASRIAGGWQLSWTGNISTGMPDSIAAANMLYGRGVPNVVGSFDPKSAAIFWQSGALAGNYFGNKYTKVKDPQCTNSSIVAPSLQASCTLTAVADAQSGQIILDNPLPGTQGNLGQYRLFSPSTWNVDMAMSKAVQIKEGMKLSIRVDVSNVFNHVQIAGTSDASTKRTTQRVETGSQPDMDINNANPFGYLGAKVGTRMFQAKLRFDF
jgi:hypothetical protein